MGRQIQCSETRWIYPKAKLHFWVPCSPSSSPFQQQLSVTTTLFAPRLMTQCPKVLYKGMFVISLLGLYKPARVEWTSSQDWALVPCSESHASGGRRASSPRGSPQHTGESAWVWSAGYMQAHKEAFSSWDQEWPNKLSLDKGQWDERNHRLVMTVSFKSHELNHTEENQGRQCAHLLRSSQKTLVNPNYSGKFGELFST